MARRAPSSRTTGRRSLGVWLALCALVIQSLLPLFDAPLHRAVSRGPVAVVASAATVTLAEHQPAHAGHDCAICQFMASLGSFTPPLPARMLPPLDAVAVVALPGSRLVAHRPVARAAQPRAPPSLI
ncbi:MAG: hypothetical protein JO021_09665 [Alphaproteobacteria bacterium]|nr:hypothetical protein [Alphaproteobacteria bacterium]